MARSAGARPALIPTKSPRIFVEMAASLGAPSRHFYRILPSRWRMANGAQTRALRPNSHGDRAGPSLMVNTECALVQRMANGAEMDCNYSSPCGTSSTPTHDADSQRDSERSHNDPFWNSGISFAQIRDFSFTVQAMP
jgi:hypothetical protein